MINKVPKHILHHIITVIGSVLLGFLLFQYLYFSETGVFHKQYKSINILTITLSSLTIGYSIYLLNLIINKVWSWKTLPSIKIISKITIITLCCYLLIEALSDFLFSLNVSTIKQADINKTELLIRFTIIILNLIVFISVSDYLTYSYYTFINNKVSIIKQQKEKSKLQLEILQNQLSPHYLFNSLNTISSLLDKEAILTEKFIRKLVFTYSYILTFCNKETVSLKDELLLVKAYEYQLKTRFEDSIKIESNIDIKYLDAKIPPLAIQTLIENAIKHNIATPENPVIINISNNKHNLIIENNITQKPENTNSNKIGLNNLKKRYTLLGNYNIKTKQTESFVVQIPLIHE